MALKTHAGGAVFYGWWIVGGCFVALFVGLGVGIYAPPVFLVPLQNHFGWSRAAIAAGSASAAVIGGVASPVVGACIDKYGSRTMMIFGALVMGTAMLLLSAMTALWQLYVLNVVAAIGFTCCGPIPIQTLISNWFRRRRGLAMGIAQTGVGFGGLVMAPLAGLLVARVGWRLAFAVLGGVILTTITAMVLAVVRSRPAEMGLLPDGDAVVSEGGEGEAGHGVGIGIDVGAALRTGAFWVLAAAHFLWLFASSSILGHFVAHLRDVGFESGVAAGALGLIGGASVAGRIVVGYFADSSSKRGVMSAALVLSALSVTLLLSIASRGALPLFVVSYGLAVGGIAVLFPLLVGEYFGLLAFGKILGLIAIAATLGMAAGPVLTGRIYDVTGSYRPAFTLLVGVFVAAALAIGFLPRPLARASKE